MNITINIDGYINGIAEKLIAKGIVRTKSEAFRLGLLTLDDKYNLNREDYYKMAEKKFSKLWQDEPKGVWESYLNEK